MEFLHFSFAGCEVIGSLISGYFVEKYGVTRMLYIGFMLMLIMGIGMLLLGKYSVPTLLGVLIPTMGVGISIGIILPNISTGAFSIFNSGIGVDIIWIYPVTHYCNCYTAAHN